MAPKTSYKRKYSGKGTGAYSQKAKRAKWGGRFADQSPATVARRKRNLRSGGFVGQELKYFDTSRANGTMVAPTDAAGAELDPAASCLFSPTQGTGATNRDGRRTIMKSIQFTGNVRCDAQIDQTGADVASLYYVAIVMDMQTNATQMASEDCFHNPGASALTAANPLRDLERNSRFKVLKVFQGRLQQPIMTYDGTNVEQSGMTIPLRWYGKLDIPVEHIADGGTVADIQDNSLHVIAYCSSTSAVPKLNYNCRVRFVG